MSGDVRQVVAALGVQLDAAAAPPLRLQTLRYLEDILGSPALSCSVGLSLLAADQPFDCSARFFGLRCLENTIIYHWDTHTASGDLGPFFSSFSDVCRGLPVVDDNNNSSSTCAPIHTKLAQIIAELAKREWPARWDLAELLNSLYLSSLAHKEIALLALAYLCNDVWNTPDADAVVANLRQPLQRALLSITMAPDSYHRLICDELAKNSAAGLPAKPIFYVPPTNTFASQSNGWFSTAFQILGSCMHAAVSSQHIAVANQVLRLCQASLLAIGAIIPWLPVDEVAAFDVPSSVLAVLALEIQSLSTPAAEIFYLYATRQWPAPVSTVLNKLSATELLFAKISFHVCNEFSASALASDTLGTNTITTTNNNNNDDVEEEEEESSETVRLLAFALVELGTRHLCHKLNVSWTPPALESYFAALLDFLKLPSTLIANAACSLWAAVLHHPYMSTTREFIVSRPGLLDALVLVQHRLHALRVRRGKKYYHDPLQTNVSLLLRKLLRCCPVEALQWLLGRVVDTSGRRQLFVWAAEVFGSVAENLPTDSKYLHVELYKLLWGMLQESPPNSTDHGAVLSCLTANVLAVANDTQQVGALVSAVIYSGRTIQATNPRAYGTILSLLNRIARTSAGAYVALIPHLRKLLAVPQDGSGEPLRVRMHLLASITAAIFYAPADVFPASSEKERAISETLGTFLLPNLFDAVARFADGPSGLLRLMLAGPDTPAGCGRSEIMIPLATLNTIFKQAEVSRNLNLLYQLVGKLAPQIIFLIAHAHRLSNAEQFACSFAEVVVASSTTTTTATTTSSSSSSSSSAESNAPIAVTNAVTEISRISRPGYRWYQNLRNVLYILLGHLTLPPLYAMENLAQAICTNVFGDVESLSNSDLSFLIASFIEKLFVYALPAGGTANTNISSSGCTHMPDTHSPRELVATIIPALLTYVVRRLDAEWPKDAAGGGGATGGDTDYAHRARIGGIEGDGDGDGEADAELVGVDADAEDDISGEMERGHDLRRLTRVFGNLLGTLYAVSKTRCGVCAFTVAGTVAAEAQRRGAGRASSSSQCSPSFCLSVLEVPHGEMLGGVLALLRYNDSRALRKGLVVLGGVLERGLASGGEAVVGGYIDDDAQIAHALLGALRNPVHAEEQPEIRRQLDALFRRTRGAMSPVCLGVLIDAGLSGQVLSIMLEEYQRGSLAKAEKLLRELVRAASKGPIAQAGQVKKSQAMARLSKVILELPACMRAESPFGNANDEATIDIFARGLDNTTPC